MVQPMSAREALLDLVKNTYMNWLLDREQRALEFDFLSRLVVRVPVRRITPHTDPKKIPEVAQSHRQRCADPSGEKVKVE